MMDLDLLIARKRLGQLAGADLVAWAVASLSDGLDSNSLRCLASLDLEGEVRVAEAEALFSSAVAELGISTPDEDLAIRAYVRNLAVEIVRGDVAPQEQVARIHAEVLSPLNHPRDLMVWCYVGDGLRPTEWSLNPDSMTHFVEIPDASLDGAIRELAEWYLAETGRRITSG